MWLFVMGFFGDFGDGPLPGDVLVVGVGDDLQGLLFGDIGVGLLEVRGCCCGLVEGVGPLLAHNDLCLNITKPALIPYAVYYEGGGSSRLPLQG